MADGLRERRDSILSQLDDQVQDLEALSVHESLPEGFQASYSTEDARELQAQEDTLRQKQTAESMKREKPTPVERAYRLYRLLAILAAGGILGVLARRGLTALSTYDGAYLTGVVWSNFTACIVMGFGLDSKEIWAHETLTHAYGTKAKIPLYIGMTTGFCGSLSSFSSMVLEMFEKAADLDTTHYGYRDSGYGVAEFLTVLFTQMSMSLAGLQAGRHLAQTADMNLPVLSPRAYGALETGSVVLGTVGWIASVVVAGAVPQGRDWSISCVFAPVGVYCRFYLSKYLNPAVKDFPAGTFACNVLGTMLLATFNLLERGKLAHNGQLVSSIVGCQLLEGLSDGFCGCFTTVSTFAVELSGLRKRKAYRYAAVSIFASFVLLLLILGPYNWAVGFTDAVC